MHEKALLVPAVVSALLAFRSVALARAYLRLSFLAAFAAFPLLPGADLRVLKVKLLRYCFAHFQYDRLLGLLTPLGLQFIAT